MQYTAPGRGTGASSVTSASGHASPDAGVRSPLASRSTTVAPPPNATASSPRTSPATGASAPGGMNVASLTTGEAMPPRLSAPSRVAPDARACLAGDGAAPVLVVGPVEPLAGVVGNRRDAEAQDA